MPNTKALFAIFALCLSILLGASQAVAQFKEYEYTYNDGTVGTGSAIDSAKRDSKLILLNSPYETIIYDSGEPYVCDRSDFIDIQVKFDNFPSELIKAYILPNGNLLLSDGIEGRGTIVEERDFLIYEDFLQSKRFFIHDDFLYSKKFALRYTNECGDTVTDYFEVN